LPISGTASGTAAGGLDLANVQLPEGMTPEMVQAGKTAFETTICYTCHGMDASGTPLAPDLTDAEWINTDGSPEGIEQIIRNGVPTPVSHPAPMPPMGGAQLSDEQSQNLVAYVYALSHSDWVRRGSSMTPAGSLRVLAGVALFLIGGACDREVDSGPATLELEGDTIQL